MSNLLKVVGIALAAVGIAKVTKDLYNFLSWEIDTLR